jgi:hypothetical protein
MRRAFDCDDTQIPLPIEDKESYMSVQGLQSMAEHARMLLQVINEGTSLPDWVEAKIIRSSSDINDVFEYYNHGGGTSKFSSGEWVVNVSLRYARKAGEAFLDSFRDEGKQGPGTDNWTFKNEDDAADFVEMLVRYWDVPADEITNEKKGEDRAASLALRYKSTRA